MTEVSSANSYLTVSNGSSTPVLTLNVGTVANTVAVGNDSRFSNARPPTGSAGGDLGGSYPSPRVDKLKGFGLDFTVAPSNGQVLTFDGGVWKAQSLPAGATGTVTSVTAGAGLSGGTITGSGTIGLGPALTNFVGVSGNGFIQKTGSTTYSTIQGAVPGTPNTLALRDATGASAFTALQLLDSASGVVTLQTRNTTASYSLKLPASQGAQNQVLANDGAGSLTWLNVPTAPSAACGSGNVLTYDGSAFVCVPDQIGSAGGGVASINGQTGSSQNLAVGSTGITPAWVSSGDTHRLNIPLARDPSVLAGTISKAEYDLFNNKQAALGYTPLRPSNNLSELTDPGAARTNLGLGSVATYNVAAGSTAAASEVVLGNDARLTDSRPPVGAASGDLGGSYPNPEMAKIKGVNLILNSLTSGQVLKYNGSAWVNGVLSQADIPDLVTDLSQRVDKTAITTCTNKQTLIYTSATDTWSCQAIVVEDSQLTYASRSAKTFLAAPTAGNGVPTFRTITVGDLPASVTDGLWTAGGGNIWRTSGNVGIGVASPSERLEVDGDVKATQVCIGADCRATWPVTASGTVTSIAAGTGLLSTGGVPITTAGTLSVDVGTTAGKILQVAAGNKLPALDASALTSLNASELTTGSIPAARLPAFSGDVSSSAGSTTLTLATVPVAKGGTGATTAAGAINNLLPSQAGQSGKFLKTDGSDVSWELLNIATIRSSASGNPAFFNVSGPCAAGEMLTYNSSSDQISCQAYSLPASVTDALWSFSGGNVYRASGNVGIGTASPGQKLTVAGVIETTSGGVKFPDGSLQTTAAVNIKNQLCPAGQYLRGFDSSGNKVCVSIGTSEGTIGYVSAVTGHHGTCAIQTDGLVKCWGYGANGMNGDSTTAQSNVPSTVRKLDGSGFYAKKLALATYYSACGIQLSDDRLYCWGTNNYGQLGTGNTTNSSFAVPVSDSTGMTTVQDVSGGYFGYCAVDMASYVWCWGSNSASGQLGDGTTATRYLPGKVKLAGEDLVGMTHVVSSQSAHSCAYSKAPGATQIYCWGYNAYGGVGDGTTVAKTSATPVVMTALTNDGVTQIEEMFAAGSGDSSNGLVGVVCAEGKTGAGTYKAYCWGYNAHGQLMRGNQVTPSTSPGEATLIGAQSAPFQLSLKSYSACYMPVSGGEVRCVGYNANGELGNGTTTSNYNAFVTVKGVGNTGTLNALRLADSSGNWHTPIHRCAIIENGSLVCWGYGSYGQLGNNAATGSTFPVGVLQ